SRAWAPRHHGVTSAGHQLGQGKCTDSYRTSPPTHPCRDGTKEEIVDLRVRRFDEIVLCGIERDELRPDTDPALLHELVLGPVYYRLLLSGQLLAADFASASSTLSADDTKMRLTSCAGTYNQSRESRL
ncbi:MAG: TetR-like C-terminal domain-containing protein, partial [Propionibacteriaceae bacterium]